MSVTHYTTLVLEHRAKCAEDIKKDKSFSLANYRARFLLKVRKTQIREVFNHYHTTSVEIVKCLRTEAKPASRLLSSSRVFAFEAYEQRNDNGNARHLYYTVGKIDGKYI